MSDTDPDPDTPGSGVVVDLHDAADHHHPLSSTTQSRDCEETIEHSVAASAASSASSSPSSNKQKKQKTKRKHAKLQYAALDSASGVLDDDLLIRQSTSTTTAHDQAKSTTATASHPPPHEATSSDGDGAGAGAGASASAGVGASNGGDDDPSSSSSHARASNDWKSRPTFVKQEGFSQAHKPPIESAAVVVFDDSMVAIDLNDSNDAEIDAEIARKSEAAAQLEAMVNSKRMCRHSHRQRHVLISNSSRYTTRLTPSRLDACRTTSSFDTRCCNLLFVSISLGIGLECSFDQCTNTDNKGRMSALSHTLSLTH
jgi:hypothetical protein